MPRSAPRRYHPSPPTKARGRGPMGPEPVEPEPDSSTVDVEEPESIGSGALSGEDDPDRLKFAPRREPLRRAGGHADYGDGRGWVPEELEK